MKPMIMAALGCFAFTAATAAAAPTYLVTEYEVIDAAGLREWAGGKRPPLQSQRGQFLSLGQTPVAAAGEPPQHVTIVLFESMEKARAYVSSPEYTALVPKREKAAKFRTFLVSGGEATLSEAIRSETGPSNFARRPRPSFAFAFAFECAAEGSALPLHQVRQQTDRPRDDEQGGIGVQPWRQME